MALFKNSKLSKLENSMNQELKRHFDSGKAFEFAEFNESEVEKTGYSNYSYWRSTFRAFSRNKAGMLMLVVVLLLLVFTIIQPMLPNQFDPSIVNNNPETGLPFKNVPPDSMFWLGTNSIGQDLWSRLWASARTSITIALSVAAIEAAVGILMGVLWGYFRKLDVIFTEIYNILDNIPSTLVLILISYILKPGIGTIIIGLSLTRWIQMGRFIRNQILIIRDREYNMASRCLGTKTPRIIFRNLLPYLVSVIMLRVALCIPEAISSEVFITYIGLGLPATTPSLGNLISIGRTLMLSPTLRYQLIYPTIVLSVITISFYVIGNAFSDAADPKNHI